MSILALSVQASPLIAAILLARAVLLHRLPRRTFSLLWALAALRLLIPLSLPSRLSIFAWGRAGMEAAAGAFGPSDALSLVPLMQDPAAGPAAPSPFFAIWALGAALCALFFLAGHTRFLWRCRTALPVEGERFAWLRGRTVRKISLRRSDAVSSPLTYGVLRPVILLPSFLLALDDEPLRFALTHELCHIRRFDAAGRWVCTLALCLHWFNPLAWVFYRFACRDMEIACDEAAILALGPSRRAGYARALLRLEEARSRLSPLSSGFSKTAIEERIVSIMKLKKLSRPALVSALALAAFITTVFATSAPPSKLPSAQDAPGSSAPSASPAAETMLWPTDAGLSPTLLFGKRVHPLTGEVRLVDHICISGPDAEGSDVCAALSGTVAFAGWAGEAGYRIELNHENGLTTVYAHCSDIAVRAGDTVAQGEVIATLGATGIATGPCLSFGVVQDGTAVDPLSFFPER